MLASIHVPSLAFSPTSSHRSPQTFSMKIGGLLFAQALKWLRSHQIIEVAFRLTLIGSLAKIGLLFHSISLKL